MALEIERKFLVTADSWRAQAHRAQPMQQGYLSSEAGQASVRVRVEGELARLNIKAAVVGAARAEYEYAIPLEDAVELLQKLCVGTIDKIRHYVEHRGHLWEIDEFLGDSAGLVVAEIELADELERFARPEWLGREVTQEQRYYNHALALHPYRTWPEKSN